MREHFTRSTVSAAAWCGKCQKRTQHRIDDGRIGPCLVCIAKYDALPKVEKPEVPANVIAEAVSRWYFGIYYGYGNRESWIPLGSMGGMATRPFDSHTVRFPARIDRKLRALLDQKRSAELAEFRRGSPSRKVWRHA